MRFELAVLIESHKQPTLRRFDTKRKAILLVAGDKSGVRDGILRQLITKADNRFDAHLNRLKQKELKEKESEQEELKKKKRN